MIWWIDLSPWEFEYSFPGSPTSTSLVTKPLPAAQSETRHPKHQTPNTKHQNLNSNPETPIPNPEFQIHNPQTPNHVGAGQSRNEDQMRGPRVGGRCPRPHRRRQVRWVSLSHTLSRAFSPSHTHTHSRTLTYSCTHSITRGSRRCRTHSHFDLLRLFCSNPAIFLSRIVALRTGTVERHNRNKIKSAA